MKEKTEFIEYLINYSGCLDDYCAGWGNSSSRSE